MFARAVCALLPVALVACAPVMVTQDTRPQAAAAALLDQCRDRDGWSDPAPPAQIFANVYQIGTCGIVVLLVTSPAGHIVIDGAPADAAPSIARNIEKLGFDLSDVRFILNSHEHFDHAGGIAELQRLTGAVLVARREAKAALETGLPDPSDPQSDNCDLLVTPHPAASNLYDRLAGGSALIDREACVDYAAGARRRLDTRLSDEAAPAG